MATIYSVHHKNRTIFRTGYHKKAYENAQKHIQPDTFNQVVRGSNLRWLTNQKPLKRSV